MSGHSKWSTIKRQKQSTDQARGQLFTKLANAITVAVKEGGSDDPAANIRLRLMMDKARTANMPKSNIERAIQRAHGKDGTANLADVLYEGFGPGGVAIVAEGVTDNKQRTAAEVKNIFSRHGGTLGGVGSALYLFDHVGALSFEKQPIEFDTLFAAAVDAGAQNIEEEEDRWIVHTPPDKLISAKQQLEKNSFIPLEFELTYLPKSLLSLSDREMIDKNITLLRVLDEVADIHKVHANLDVSH